MVARPIKCLIYGLPWKIYKLMSFSLHRVELQAGLLEGTPRAACWLKSMCQ